jgi:hypothetical protein
MRNEEDKSLATTCNTNEQQQDDKNNAELYTEWTKTSWKTFEETIRRGRYRSIKAQLLTDEDDDDDDNNNTVLVFLEPTFINCGRCYKPRHVFASRGCYFRHVLTSTKFGRKF